MGNDDAYKLDTQAEPPYTKPMTTSYGKKILDRVDKLKLDVKAKFTLYFSVSVYEEFKKKCGDRAPSIVLEEMMKDFNESTPEPKEKRK